MKNKLFAFVLIIAIVFTSFPVFVITSSAAEIIQTEAQITVEQVYAKRNMAVEVNVLIKDNPGILSMTLKVNYDETRLRLVGVESGGAMSYLDFTVPKDLGSGCTLPWDAESINPDDIKTKSGTLAVLTFEVLDTVNENDFLAIDVVPFGTIQNNDLNSLLIDFVPGHIRVLNYIPGDVNGDGIINATDVSYLRRWIAGGYYNVVIDEAAADVNGDGIINTTDTVYIRRYIAGGYGITLLPSTLVCVHEIEYKEAVAATCTEAGNSEYWHCTKCGKYFADEAGSNEISLESTMLEAKGHSYSAVWSFDKEYHWHDASCGCGDAGVIDKARHIIGDDGHCECGYSAENNYTVQYYWENIEDSGYTLHETVFGYAPVGSVVNAEIKKYEHFKPVDSSASAIIDSNDITILKVYYSRDVYTITFNPNGGRLFGMAVQKVKYGGNATLPEFEREPDDYFFYEIDRYNGIYENVQSDATVTVIWKTRRMNELSVPSNVTIDNDIVSWSHVENATSYVVTAGDYSYETKSTSCALSRLKNAIGEVITDYGTIEVTVTAVGKLGYKNSTSSAIPFFYVPETTGADYDELYKWNIGHGYNLIENEYLKLNEFRSNLTVFNLGKLLTIGTADINSKNNQTTYDAYSFSSVEDYMSQLNIDFNTSASVGANASFWKFKAAATLKTALGLSMSTTLKEYNNTQIIFYNFYVSQGIKSIKFKESDEKLLKYSLSNTFVKDILKRSNATKDYVTNEQLAEYIYKTYGTHAILGVVTGGILSSTYVAATNKAELAIKLKESSSVDSSAEAGGSYAGATASVNTALGVSQSAEVENGIKHEESYVKSTIDSYGGKPKVELSNNPNDAISLDNWELDDNTGMPMAVYNGMAYDISYLIGLYDAGFAQYYAEYVDSIANDEFRELTKQFERKNSIPTDVSTENDKNILTIDLSAYQNSGLDNAYSPNLLNNVLTVYPVYCGKYIDKIVIKGGFNEADKHNLMAMTVKLASGWKRNVEVCFENCGIESTVTRGAIDISDVALSVNVSLTYSGYNVICDSEKVFYVHASKDGKAYDYTLKLADDESISISACGIDGTDVVLPIATKEGYDFAGWQDVDEVVITNALGKIDETKYSKNELSIRWNRHIVEVSLREENADTQGTAKYYEQYGIGYFSDYECNTSIDRIEIPTRKGYVFGGYYKSVSDNATANAKGENMVIDGKGVIALSLDVTDASVKRTELYALWIPCVYTVTLNTDGGTSLSNIYVKYKTGVYSDKECKEPISEISAPSKNPFVFDGFKFNGNEVISADGTINADFLKKTLDDVIAIASWKNPYVITLDDNGVNAVSVTKYYTSDFKSFFKNPDSWELVDFESILNGVKHPIYPDYIQLNWWYIDEQLTVRFNASELAKNPCDVTLYANWSSRNNTTEYTSIDSTPFGLPAGTVIIDWSKEEETDLLNHRDRNIGDYYASNDRFDNIDIYPGTTKVILIGDPSKVYKNFTIHICSFGESDSLEIVMQDFNFVSRYAVAINGYETVTNLTINVVGNCSITAGAGGGAAISLVGSDISIIGNGTLTVKGGNGAAGVNYGDNGSDGGTGIVADTLTVDMTGNLSVMGGDGGAGKSNANNPKQSNSLRYGGKGGNGGAAIVCESITTEAYSFFQARGGNGGNGGYGFKTKSNAGVGGKGGNGGHGIVYSTDCTLESSLEASSFDVVGGSGGSGGDAQKWNVWGGDQTHGSSGDIGSDTFKNS